MMGFRDDDGRVFITANGGYDNNPNSIKHLSPHEQELPGTFRMYAAWFTVGLDEHDPCRLYLSGYALVSTQEENPTAICTYHTCLGMLSDIPIKRESLYSLMTMLSEAEEGDFETFAEYEEIIEPVIPPAEYAIFIDMDGTSHPPAKGTAFMVV